MKKILFLVLGLVLGAWASVALGANWTEVSRINLGFGIGEVRVYSVIDNGNTCYVSVYGNSNAISCLKGEMATKEYMDYINVPLNITTPLPTPSISENVPCRSKTCRSY